MNAKDKVTVRGITYEVLGEIGSGGQGAVWRVKSSADGKIYALKIINEKDPNRRANKVANIQRLVNERVDKKLDEAVAKGSVQGINHACPLGYYVDPVSHATGYIMELAEGKTLNKMLIEGTIEKMSIEQKLVLLKRIAASIDVLHSIGFCYTDINWGNFMWSEQTDTLYVIDCENMACRADILNGKCSFLIGTGFFIAPEVAFGSAKAEYNSDKYALASLIFRVLTNNVLQSAYHGVAMYSANPACQNMLDVAEMESEDDIDPNWRKFVFDPNDRSNGLDNLCKNSKNPENIAFRKEVERVIHIWANLDQRLKELFYQTFADPFDHSKRLMPSTWVREIDKILSNNTTPLQVIPVQKQPQQSKANAQVAVKPAPKAVYQGFNQKPINPLDAKYPSFTPSGSGATAKPTQQALSTLPNKPYLISTANIAIAITDDDFVVEGPKLGLKQNIIGRIKSTDEGYVFVSQLLSTIEILDIDGNPRETLYKGQEATLASGESVKPIISSVAVKLIY